MVVGAVIGTLDVDPPDPLDALPLLVLVQVVRSPGCATRCLQQGVVGTPAVLRLVQEDVQGLLIDSGLGELNLRRQEQPSKSVCFNTITSQNITSSFK